MAAVSWAVASCLHSSAERYRRVFSQSSAGIAVLGVEPTDDETNPRLRIIEANRSLADCLERPLSALTGRYAAEVFPAFLIEGLHRLQIEAMSAQSETIEVLDPETERFFDLQAYSVSRTQRIIVLHNRTREKRADERRERIAREYEYVFHSTQDALFLLEVVDEDTFRFLRTNRSHQQRTGLAPDDLWGRTPYEVVDAELAERLTANYRRCVRAGASIAYEEEIHLPAGNRVSATTLTPVQVAEDCLYLVGSSTDATEKKQMEAALMTEKERLATTLESLGDGVISTSKDGLVLMMNPAAERLTGWRKDEAVGHAFNKVFCTEDVDGLPSRRYAEHRESVLVSLDGQRRTVAHNTSPIMDTRGEQNGTVTVFRDVSEAQRQQRIEYLSFNDKLTGVYNRAYFEREVQRLDTNEHYPLALIMGDINGLKLINDGVGHTAGDSLLVRSAEAFKGAVRKTDIVARWGDEFVALLPQTDAETAMSACERIKRESGAADGDLTEPIISLGVAVKEEAAEEFWRVFRRAEDAMYRDKIMKGEAIQKRLIDSLQSSLFSKSLETDEHCRRVGELAVAVGKKMGLPALQIEDLRTLGRLHDIGKIAVPRGVLNTRGPLTPEQDKEMRKHSEAGYRIFAASNHLSHLADAFDVLHHGGRANEPLPLEKVLDSLAALADSALDPRVVKVLTYLKDVNLHVK